MRTWLKWIFARREMAELERRRALMLMYRQWLAEFKDVVVVLDNLEAESMGDFLDGSLPPGPRGPWTIDGLRHHLRHPSKPATHIRRVTRAADRNQ